MWIEDFFPVTFNRVEYQINRNCIERFSEQEKFSGYTE